MIKRLGLDINKDVISMFKTAGDEMIKSVGTSFNVPIMVNNGEESCTVEKDIIIFNKCDSLLILGNT